ncbi:MAG TPA: low affinity iron permease family protein [Thermoleophilaceae bacterium]|jgi:low affinity Fe/Cu permease
MSTKHPTERGGEGHSAFDTFSERASNLTSSPFFFAFCVLLIAAWVASYVFDAGSTLQHILEASISSVTLFLLALLKNSELRAEQAIQEKLDAIAAAMLEQEEGEAREAREHLRHAIGRHDEV